MACFLWPTALLCSQHYSINLNLLASQEAEDLSPTAGSQTSDCPFEQGTLDHPTRAANIQTSTLPSLKAVPIPPMLKTTRVQTTNKYDHPPSQVGAHLTFFIDHWEALDPRPSVLSLVWELELEFNAPPPLMHARQAPDLIRGLSSHKQSSLRTEVNTLRKK